MKNFKEIVVTVFILIGLLVCMSILAGAICAIGYKVFLWVV